MSIWAIVAIGAYLGLIVFRGVAVRRLRDGKGSLAPFLIGPTLFLILLPIAVILAAAPTMGWASLILAGFMGLNAFLVTGPLLKAVNAARRESSVAAFDAYTNALGEGMLASMALTLGAAVVGGIALVIYLMVSR